MERNWYLVQHASGRLLSWTDGALTLQSRGNDSSLWVPEAGRLRSAAGRGQVDVEWGIADDGGRMCRLVHGSTGVPADTYRLRAGPARLPSDHLADLEANGITVLELVLDDAALARLRVDVADNRARAHSHEGTHDGHFWMTDGLAWCADLARAATHPVALWLLEQYMETHEIHFCHQPIVTTLKPARALRGTFPEGGWHSDYPYHQGVFPHEQWPARPVLGAQYNVCVDAFTTTSGATQFLPGSHAFCKPPSPAFNRGGTRMGEGVHKHVRQMLAPAGAAVIYDARTWHRACDELNASGRDRVALLNAVAPAWVLPMIDKASLVDRYVASGIPELLTEREREDIKRLCNSPTADTPDNMPRLQSRRR